MILLGLIPILEVGITKVVHSMDFGKPHLIGILFDLPG